MSSFNMNTMHGWFSEKQQHILKNVKLTRGYENQVFHRPFIYYLNTNNKVVMITEITGSLNTKPRFDDVQYLGTMKQFHKASTKPINICNENRYYYAVNPEITHNENLNENLNDNLYEIISNTI